MHINTFKKSLIFSLSLCLRAPCLADGLIFSLSSLLYSSLCSFVFSISNSRCRLSYIHIYTYIEKNIVSYLGEFFGDVLKKNTNNKQTTCIDVLFLVHTRPKLLVERSRTTKSLRRAISARQDLARVPPGIVLLTVELNFDSIRRVCSQPAAIEKGGNEIVVFTVDCETHYFHLFSPRRLKFFNRIMQNSRCH